MSVGHDRPSQADRTRAALDGAPVQDAYANAVPLAPPAGYTTPEIPLPPPGPPPGADIAWGTQTPRSPAAVPALRDTARRWRLATLVVAVVAVIAAVVAIVALSNSDSDQQAAAPAPAAPPVALPAAPAPVSPEDAKAATCGVLKEGYESVANAIDNRNRFNSAPWTDPAMLNATTTLVQATEGLADALEMSLSSSTPKDVRDAVVEYVAGLRALGISQRNHARDMQLNGVGAFYNQVVDAPLRICGIPG